MLLWAALPTRLSSNDVRRLASAVSVTMTMITTDVVLTRTVVMSSAARRRTAVLMFPSGSARPSAEMTSTSEMEWGVSIPAIHPLSIPIAATATIIMIMSWSGNPSTLPFLSVVSLLSFISLGGDFSLKRFKAGTVRARYIKETDSRTVCLAPDLPSSLRITRTESHSKLANRAPLYLDTRDETSFLYEHLPMVMWLLNGLSSN